MLVVHGKYKGSKHTVYLYLEDIDELVRVDEADEDPDDPEELLLLLLDEELEELSSSSLRWCCFLVSANKTSDYIIYFIEMKGNCW